MIWVLVWRHSSKPLAVYPSLDDGWRDIKRFGAVTAVQILDDNKTIGFELWAPMTDRIIFLCFKSVPTSIPKGYFEND